MTDGTLERRDDHQVLRFERRLDHPVERVWRALTEPDELAAWLALAELELTEGGRVVLTWQNTDPDGNTAVARGTVSALDPPRLLELDTDIHGRLRWEPPAIDVAATASVTRTTAVRAATGRMWSMLPQADPNASSATVFAYITTW